jgi:hypothetical protein
MTRGLRLFVRPGRYVVCRLDASAESPAEVRGSAFASVTRTADELSIVCEERLAPYGSRCEPGWRCLALEGPIPFTATGVLAALLGPLAEAHVGIFSISTFDTDYLLVKDDQLEAAIAALRASGHHVTP